MNALIKLAAAVALIGIVSSCATNPYSGGPAVEADREPASDVNAAFDAMLKSAESPQKLWEDSVNQLLNLNYRAEGLLLGFEKGIDNALQKQKANKNYFVEPTSSPIYMAIQVQRELIETLNTQLIGVYKRLYETANQEPSAQSDWLHAQAGKIAKDRATDLLNAIHLLLNGLPEKDQLQLASLIELMEDVHTGELVAGGAPVSDRMPASVSASYGKFHATFKKFHAHNLSKLYKKHRKETYETAQAAAKQAYPDVEALSVMEPVSDRSPAGGGKLVPGIGENGNVMGMVFPRGTFVLSFDDGPKPSSTERLLGILKENNAPATFFMLAQNATAFKDTVAKVKAAGFPMNSHSWSHANLTLASTNLDREITQANARLTEIFAYPPGQNFKFFRCPYGACYAPKSVKVRQMIADAGLLHAYWVVDSNDWKFMKDEDRTLALTKKEMLASGRGVILFHDIHETSVDVIKVLLPWIKQQKYTLKTLEKAVADYNASVQ